MTVTMLMSLGHQDLPQARRRAQRIQSRAQPESRNYRLATAVLALDPNRPAPVNKKPDEPK
ncbi:MAG: hypothetical protein MUC88_21825 [Planctomycetes bacterium]|nr:hypothetical protein [Planctomycetota bacterium]